MKRWTLRILICLIVGAITTVAVAWGVHYWPYDGSHDSGIRTYSRSAAGGSVVERGTIVISMNAGWPEFAICGIEGTRPQPIWPGFLIDTLFYAAIWFGVFFGFTSAKRFIRIKRGRCPRCGYDLRGGVISDKRLAMSGEDESATFKPQASGLKPSSGCPECGWGRPGDSSRRDEGM